MRKPRRRAPNPGYQEPRAYLAGGFFAADGRTIRPALLTDLAASMGRELLIRGVPLELVKQTAEQVQAIAVAPAPDQPARLQALAARPGLNRHPLLAQLVREGARQIQRPEELAAFAAHLRRVLVLASFERTLASASAADLARSERAVRVRRAKERRSGR